MNLKTFFSRCTTAVVAGSLLAFAAGALAGPANPNLQYFKQRNGTTIQGRLAGDEHLNWIETTNGDVFLLNRKSGLYEYGVIKKVNGKSTLMPSGIAVGAGQPPALTTAKPAASLTVANRKLIMNSLLKEAHKANQATRPKSAVTAQSGTTMQAMAVAPAQVPLLVVLVNYTDNVFQSSDATWQQKVFGTNEGQMNHYFSEISRGRFRYVPAAESHGTANDGVVHVSLNYPNPNPDRGGGTIALDALARVDQYVNFAQFDVNGDGRLGTQELSVIFIFGGAECSYGAGTNACVWGHAAGLPQPNIFDAVAINDYVAFGERHGDHDATIGIIAHELGHQTFYLPDLYEPFSNFVYWDLMGQGSWGRKNGDAYIGQTPTHMSAYTKAMAGFVSTTDIDLFYAPNNVSLYAPKNANYNAVKVLTNSWNSFMVEQRRLEGYDRGLTTDSSLYGKYGVMVYRSNRVVRANNVDSGNFALTDMYYPGNNTRLAPNTMPNSYIDGVNVGAVFENIASTTDTMTLAIKRDDPNGYYCKIFTATNSAHVTANRAYTTGTFIKTYFANGSNQNLGTSGTTSTTLKEAPAGYFTKATACSYTNQKPVVQSVTVYPETVYTYGEIQVSDVERDLVRAEYQLDGGAWVRANGTSQPTEGNFFYSFSLYRLSSGSHQVNVRAYDAAGNVSTVFGPRSFTVPAQSAPACTVDRVNKDTAGYYVAYGTSSDVDNDMATVDIRVDGGAWLPAGIDYVGKWNARTSTSPSGLSQGTHTVQARATDAGGRVTLCGPLSFLVGIESAPEIKNVISTFAGSDVSVYGDATDVDGDVAAVDYSIDNGSWIPAESFYVDDTRIGRFSINAGNVATGQHAFRVRARDAGGRYSAIYTANINLPPPTAPTCSISRVFYDAANVLYNVEGTFADVNNDAGQVELSYDQTNWYGIFAFGGNFLTPLPNQPLPNGNYVIYVRATDQGGRTGLCQQPFTINGYGNPPTIGTPAAAVNGLSVTVSGTAADADNNLSSVEVQFDTATAPILTATGTANWSLVNTSLGAGTHQVHARAKDAAGNTSAWSNWVSFTLAAAPSCFTAANSAHASAGRATLKYVSLYYANGSNDYLGTATTTTSLQLQSPNYWKKVTSCP